MLHGEVGTGSKKININKLRNKNIDYLALGHIHSYQTGIIEEDKVYAYCGCLEPRGFDELNEKGFIDRRFHSSRLRQIREAGACRFLRGVLSQRKLPVCSVCTPSFVRLEEGTESR